MICVLTHARPGGASYLASTIKQIDATAAGVRIIVADDLEWSTPFQLPGHWRVHRFARPATERPQNKWATWECFRLAVEAREELIILEDDIDLCANGARYMETAIVPQDSIVGSFYDPYFDAEVPRGWWRQKMVDFRFGQAMKFSRVACLTLLELRESMTQIPRVGGDDMLTVLGRRAGWTAAIHCPSIVQHVGAVSAVGNGFVGTGELGLTSRTSRSFRCDLDAFKCDPRIYI